MRVSRFRILLSSVGILGVFFLPWFVPAGAALLLAFKYAAPEVVVIGLLFDLTWGPGMSALHVPYATLLSLVVLFALEPLRREFLSP